jgi:hypothetical protein
MDLYVNKRLVLLIFLGTLVICILVFLYWNPQLSIINQFNNLNNYSHIGGLLIHMMSISDLENSMKNDNFDIGLTADCAPFNRKTCSAWTLVRKDLPPMVFIFPGPDSPNLGIIINANSAWDLVTTMGNIDSNTMNRNCCQQENGSPQITRWPGQTPEESNCISQMLKTQGFDVTGKYKNYLVYIPTINKDGQMCPSSCAHDDLFCKYNNAGASIDMYDMYNWKQCIDGKFNNCYTFKVQKPEDIPDDLKNIVKTFTNQPSGYLVQSTKKDCKICNKPYICVTKPPPTDVAKTGPVVEDKQISAYVDSDGLGWNKMFTPNGNLDPWNIATTQCKWEKKDMDKWMNSLKKYYSDIYSNMNSDNSMPTDMNYFLSNPDHIVYLENEVNIYVDGDRSSSNYKNQNSVFMNSIEGFFWIPTTCEKQLSTVNNIITNSATSQYTTAEERCDAYYETISGDARRQHEQEQVDLAKSTVIKFTSWFNKKYKKNVGVYSANLNSNSFPNKSQIGLAGNNNITFDSIFTKL